MIKTVFSGTFLIIFALAGVVFGFHEGGAGYCEGCHTMFLSPESGTQNTSRLTNNIAAPILNGSDASSTCLRCHSEPGRYYTIMSDDGSQFTPGGDFYWLSKTFMWSQGVTNHRSDGDNHGHNVEAIDYSLTPDLSENSSTITTTRPTAPLLQPP